MSLPIDHVVDCYDEVKMAGLDAIMGLVTDHRYQVLAVSTWDGQKIKALIRIGDRGGEYVVVANKTPSGLELSIEKNWRYKAWPGVEMDDLGLGLPRWSKAARDPGREIWEHSFRNHYKEPPKWIDQPDHIKAIIRDRYAPGSSVKEVNGDNYYVRQDGTWYHSLAFTTNHQYKERALVKAGLGVGLAATQIYYPDINQWLRIQRDVKKAYEREINS